MNKNSPVEIIHQAMVKTFKHHFSDRLKFVHAYNPGKCLQSPGIYLGMHQMEVGENPGDGRQLINADWFSYIVLGNSTDNLAIKIRYLACEVMDLLNQPETGLWGLNNVVCLPEHIQAMPALFNPDTEGYESWEVTWQQSFYIGESIWDDDGEPPKTVLASHEPKTGKAHEPEYEPI
ncbi:hypothetical protein [Zooshikella ganghwensis]|uniref:hypothetical protein n=1 Tax=Zooshikella ganghwensis TaxID=202772 RepID=UPI0004864A1D|nr:hypothetical protein [Zooshikella ganghwensis]